MVEPGRVLGQTYVCDEGGVGGGWRLITPGPRPLDLSTSRFQVAWEQGTASDSTLAAILMPVKKTDEASFVGLSALINTVIEFSSW